MFDSRLHVNFLCRSARLVSTLGTNLIISSSRPSLRKVLTFYFVSSNHDVHWCDRDLSQVWGLTLIGRGVCSR